MKRQFEVTVEIRKFILVPVEAADEVEAEELAGYEVETMFDENDPVFSEWFVYDVREVDV